MEFAPYDPELLFQEVKEQALEEGISTQEEFETIVEDVVNRHFEQGEINEEEDYEALKETLRSRWNEFEESLDGQSESGDTEALI